MLLNLGEKFMSQMVIIYFDLSKKVKILPRSGTRYLKSKSYWVQTSPCCYCHAAAKLRLIVNISMTFLRSGVDYLSKVISVFD